MPTTTHFPVFPKSGSSATNVSPLKSLIGRLTGAFGPSGSEEAVRGLIREEVKAHADEVRVDALGNLIARKRGSSATPRPKVMLAAHMDEIGLMVTHIDEKGFCRFAALGPIQPLSLLGQRCLFASGKVGVIGRELKKAKPNEIEVDRLFIDVGARSAADSPVAVGDAATLYGEFVESGPRLIGKALDDRVGCAVLIETLRQIKKCPNDLLVVFTVQQQVGARGATTSSFGLEPDFALAVDVTETGDKPESPTREVALGKGPAIKVKDPGILVSPAVRNVLLDAARQAQVPYQFEVVPEGQTDAGVIQVSREGTHAGALSIPLRYSHTPSEVVDFDDVQAAIKLLLALLGRPLLLGNGK